MGQFSVSVYTRGNRQDITGLAETPTLEHGKSWTAKILAAPIALISEKGALNVKKAVDTAGKFWHETLLWDRIADLQFGIYTQMKTSLINKGMSEMDAAKVAAHTANRFAGALPKEAMGQMSREVLNLALFSRTFTMGNLGVMKDMVKGLPSDVQAQILKGSGDVSLKVANNAMRKEAIAAFAMEIGLFYIGNSLLQDWLQGEFKKGKQAWLKGYMDRYQALKDKPLADILTHPFHSLESLTSLATNEPGKEGRIKVEADRDGTMYYVRFPFGKIGEEFINYLGVGSAVKQLGNKTSTMLRPIIEDLRNEDYAGRKIWDDSKNAAGWKQARDMIGHFLKAQVPYDQVVSAWKLASGEGRDMDFYKVVGPLLGLTPSKGAPGGPEVGEMMAAERDYADRKSFAIQDVKEKMDRMKAAEDKGDKVRADKLHDEAYDILEKAGVPPREILSTLNRYDNPGVTKGMTQRFNKHATEEQRLRASGLR